MEHGAPSAETRHVGDLGNIEADSTQTANVNIKDSMIKVRPRPPDPDPGT